MKTNTQRDYEERILKILVHIQSHLDEALDLVQLADLAHFSPFHFHRVFRGMVGEAVMEHVRRLRLERAAHQLKSGTQPVTQIAFGAGYETHEAFTRAFRALFAEPPSRFRELHSRWPVQPAPSGVHYAADGQIARFEPRQAEGESMDARIEKLDPLRVAFMRHTGPYHEVGPVWERFCGWAGMRGLFGPKTKMFGLCHDDPEVTPPDKIRYDVCLVVDESFQPEGDVGVQEVGGGDYAVTTHCGPYAGLASTYATLMGQWLPAQGREPSSGPSLEMYQNNPQTTAPQDLRTDIYVPLRPA
ncbi:MAG: AraC family transcriptional regulator [Planctomycetes bacterium]|nr:AraC family transcriptional regulator [Planctomycetota bacterium]